MARSKQPAASRGAEPREAHPRVRLLVPVAAAGAQRVPHRGPGCADPGPRPERLARSCRSRRGSLAGAHVWGGFGVPPEAVNDWHYAMLNDSHRNDFYYDAMAGRVQAPFRRASHMPGFQACVHGDTIYYTSCSGREGEREREKEIEKDPRV